jgi:CMP-N-acetylneuraminic acid synthetase
MSALDSVDIDTLEDFEIASAVAFLRRKAGQVPND